MTASRPPIVIDGARTHTLRNVRCEIPQGALTVVTGVSGSGKSSLAFDTLYAEGQRRFVESLSTYARQFLERLPRPDVDAISALPPAIAVEQRNGVRNARSTVGTVTEVSDFLRLVFARVAEVHCPACGARVAQDTVEAAVERLLREAAGRRLLLVAPIRLGGARSTAERLLELQQAGYRRLLVEGKTVELEPLVSLLSDESSDEPLAVAALRRAEEVRLVLDRVSVPGAGNAARRVGLAPAGSSSGAPVGEADEAAGLRARLGDAITQAFALGEGRAEALLDGESQPLCFNEGSDCPRCGRAGLPMRPPPALFSFNSPLGACDTCQGFGRVIGIDLDKVIPDGRKSLREGAVSLFLTPSNAECQADLVRLAPAASVRLGVPWSQLSERERRWVVDGDPSYQPKSHDSTRWYGVRGLFRYLESKKYKMHVRVLLSRYRGYDECPGCRGARLRPEARAVVLPGGEAERGGAAVAVGLPGGEAERGAPAGTLLSGENAGAADATTSRGVTSEAAGAGYTPGGTHGETHGETHGGTHGETHGGTHGGTHGWSIDRLEALPISDLRRFVDALPGRLTAQARATVASPLSEIAARLAYLDEVGLGYLSLGRQARTLSGGEAQRIALAAALGAQLTGTLYVLDEPSVGLHPADTARLVAVLSRLTARGNTVVVVEHDPEIMAAADWILDLGPGPGRRGGSLVFAGTPEALLRSSDSVTGQHLRARRTRARALRAIDPAATTLDLLGASAHNLRGIDVSFHAGRLNCITGVSGSGKSTLLVDVLYGQALRARGEAVDSVGACEALRGFERFDRVELVDQSPLARSSRSNPATYLKAMDELRQRFAATEEAAARGLGPGAFSTNVEGGRCEACQGQGEVTLEMHFLADVTVPCDACLGRRFGEAVLGVRLRGRNILEWLQLSVDEAIALGADDRKLVARLQPFVDVGLGYLALGQSTATLSGGESQRLKLAAHLGPGTSRAPRGRPTLFVLDEPTTGLHGQDVAVLLAALDRLLDAGHTVIAIEHNLDFIANADWLVELGPGGGAAGGALVAAGTPEELARAGKSLTAQALCARQEVRPGVRATGASGGGRRRS